MVVNSVINPCEGPFDDLVPLVVGVKEIKDFVSLRVNFNTLRASIASPPFERNRNSLEMRKEQTEFSYRVVAYETVSARESERK